MVIPIIKKNYNRESNSGTTLKDYLKQNLKENVWRRTRVL